MSELRGLHLHVDCASGAAGDMLLGALLDLGVPLGVVREALDAIGAGSDRLRITKVVKSGIAATDLKVDTHGELPGVGRHEHHAVKPMLIDTEDLVEATEIRGAPTAPEAERTQMLMMSDLAKLVERSAAAGDHRHAHPHTVSRPHAKSEPAIDHRVGDTTGSIETSAKRPPAPANHDHHHEHEHEHEHEHHHAHYHYADIRKRIVDAPLADGTRRLAIEIFDRIARAEAKLHGTTIDEVAFHEVGAIDSVVDVVGTAAALAWLAPASVSCTSVAMGHGTIHCSHGVLPVPAPAALEVMREAGGVMADGGIARELCTPTGAAILATAVTTWGPAPTGRAVAVGWGAGDADLADRANVLRVVAVEPIVAGDAIWQIDANIDDMSPELCAPAAEAIFSAGALDVWWTPITMKKGRPALALSALASTAQRDLVIAAILHETTTIGVRYSQRERTVLARSTVEVPTRFGSITMKVARDGEAIVNAAPEYEACAAAAKLHGVSVKSVYAAALAAFESTK